MLNEAGVAFEQREYTEEPLSLAELKALFATLDRPPRDLLRARDATALGLTGNETDAELLQLMAAHPTLLQRPILVRDEGTSRRAVLGRPVDDLLELT